MNPPSATEVQASTSKKRIPKACNSCRHSKVRCDEQRPCTRCRSLQKTCVYIEKPKTIEEARIEELEQQVVALKQQLSSQFQSRPQSWSSSTMAGNPVAPPLHQETLSPQSNVSLTHSSPSYENSLKRKRAHFSLQSEVVFNDFVTEGILSESQAMEAFASFFRGCDRYVPIFDASDDYQSVRSRSSLLLNTICTIGCGVSEIAIIDSRSLSARLKRSLATVILSPHTHSLETVQALMIMACWMAERSLILAVATRIAIDLRLADAFDQLVGLAMTGNDDLSNYLLMKRVRTWFGLLVLEKILQLDAGNQLKLKVKGVRRCRTLLNRPFSTALDMRLFSQIELNHLRAKFNDAITADRDDVQATVQDARIDIDVWYHDWRRIIETSPTSGPEGTSLITNLTVQRHWADAMLMCRAIRMSNLQDVSAMSGDQRALLGTARDALQCHLDVMLDQRHYLTNFKYAMDFVWAKCAYSFLLLVKLTRLLSTDLPLGLVDQGKALLETLDAACTHASSRVYLRLLEVTVEKCGWREGQQSSGGIESFVPEEFVFEWDFPGLNLFSSFAGWELLFDQYLLGDDLFLGLEV